jgi:hypothetical protein
VHRQYHGSKNAFESWVTVHSIGPVKSLGPLLVEKVAQSFSGSGAAVGTFAGFMWLASQLGACPEASALPAFNGPVPGWDATSKLSGLAADMWCLKYDDKGKMFPTGVPERGRVVEGVGVYDPRLDSTFPGGSGSCRINDPKTYILGSENPALHAITWAYGHWQNGTLIAGGGLDVNGIDGQPFAEWASVCEANNWKVGGIVYTATDDSWDVLKMIAQAGGGEVMPVGALLSCTFSAPRVSIGTISTADIAGDVEVPGTASRRLRRNTVIPRVRLEAQGWQVVPLDALTIDEYVTVDGGTRPKELDLPLVQQADQGAELGLYDILNGRELDGITLPCKIYALGYRPGDCLTINIPEADLVNRTVIVRNRELDTASLGVTLTCRTETAGKHDFALGKTATPPRTPDLSVPAHINYGVDWDDVYGPNKPEDRATYGAPDDSPVGDRTASEIVSQLTTNTTNALYATAFAISKGAELDALKALQDGSAATVAINNLTTTIQDPDFNGKQTVNLIGARQPDGNGGYVFVISQNTAYGTPGKLLGQTIDGIQSQVGGHEASITAIRQIITAPDGSSELRALTTLNADGVITGTINTLTGKKSRYAVLADEFYITSLDSNGIAYNPFTIIDGQVTMLDVVVRKLSYAALIPLFGDQYSSLNPDYGWEIMPSGKIRQWGKLRQTINSEVAFSIVWPKQFKTVCTARGGHPFVAAFNTSKDLYVQNVGEASVSGGSFQTQASTGNAQSLDGIDWWAEGY